MQPGDTQQQLEQLRSALRKQDDKTRFAALREIERFLQEQQPQAERIPERRPQCAQERETDILTAVENGILVLRLQVEGRPCTALLELDEQQTSNKNPARLLLVGSVLEYIHDIPEGNNAEHKHA